MQYLRRALPISWCLWKKCVSCSSSFSAVTSVPATFQSADSALTFWMGLTQFSEVSLICRRSFSDDSGILLEGFWQLLFLLTQKHERRPRLLRLKWVSRGANVTSHYVVCNQVLQILQLCAFEPYIFAFSSLHQAVTGIQFLLHWAQTNVDLCSKQLFHFVVTLMFHRASARFLLRSWWRRLS